MQIKDLIRKTIEGIFGFVNFLVEHPGDEKKGDFATNVALVMAKDLGKNPGELAEEMVKRLAKDENLMGVVEKMEVAGPGFINFWVKDEVLIQKLQEMKDRNNHAIDSEFMSGKKVLVEYSSPNIAKRFSVGHFRSTIIGQAILNFYRHSGAEVTSDNHLGDWGTQFGMIIAAIEERNLDVLMMTIAELEDLYVDFNKRITETPELKNKAREAFARLERGEEGARKIWQQAVEVSMKEFGEIYSKLGVTFEHQYGESAYEKEMPGIIKEVMESGVGEKGEGGALVVKFEKDGKEYMSPAMLQKGDGTTTYFTRDLATIRKRLDDPKLKSDLYVYEVGSEQKLHLRQVFETVEKLEWAKKEQFVHVAHGRMTFQGEKMSTRKGNTVKLDDLLFRSADEAKKVAKERADKITSEKIGMGAIKYNDLRRSPESDYDFRWEEALSMEGNSGPYLQYVYVRTKGILEKTQRIKNSKNQKIETIKNQTLNEDERSLLKWLVLRFGEGEVVENAARNYAPHLVCQSLFELAQRFNGFYDRNRVVGVEEENLRLLLVTVTGLVIKSGLNILGIETVEKM